LNRIVSSAGTAIQTWLIETSPSPHLVSEASVSIPASFQDPGFFTVVSSNGGHGDSAIIWSLARPASNDSLTLIAFAAIPSNGTFKQLYSSTAGPWVSLLANANAVPVVANGKVYVASYQTLMIFGANGTAAPRPAVVPGNDTRVLSQGVSNRVSGILLSVDGATLTLRTPTGRSVRVNSDLAMRNGRTGILVIGNRYTVFSSGVSADGVQQAVTIARAKRATSAWPPDQ